MPEGSTLIEEIVFLGEDGKKWITEKFAIDGKIIAERTTPYNIENDSILLP